MKAYPKLHYGKTRGFTLLELIGVLAIISILAAAVAPTALRSIEATAIKADKQSTQAIAAAVREYVRVKNAIPNFVVPNDNVIPQWAYDVAPYAGASETDVWKSKRTVIRRYLWDATTNRAMILSAMRTGLTLPTQASTSTANFNLIWQTTDGSVPTATNWPSGWTTASLDDPGQYLTIERIYLGTALSAKVITFAIESGTPSYRITPKSTGTTGAAILTATTQNLASGDRIDFYSDNAASILVRSYIVTDRNQNFKFDGVWKSDSP